jgi:HEAT repeat protein
VSLARLGDRHAQLMLDSHDYYLRLNAALAVASLGDNNAFDRLVAMQREAATPVERVYLTAALAMLKQPNGAMELNEALIALAGSQEYGDGTDLFLCIAISRKPSSMGSPPGAHRVMTS